MAHLPARIKVRGSRERGSGPLLTIEVPDMGLRKDSRMEDTWVGNKFTARSASRPQARTHAPESWGCISDLWERGAVEPITEQRQKKQESPLCGPSEKGPRAEGFETKTLEAKLFNGLRSQH